MPDRFASRRSFLRKIFAGAGAVVVAGPAVLEALDRMEPSTTTHVDMGKNAAEIPEWYKVEAGDAVYAATIDMRDMLKGWAHAFAKGDVGAILHAYMRARAGAR